MSTPGGNDKPPSDIIMRMRLPKKACIIAEEYESHACYTRAQNSNECRVKTQGQKRAFEKARSARDEAH